MQRVRPRTMSLSSSTNHIFSYPPTSRIYCPIFPVLRNSGWYGHSFKSLYKSYYIWRYSGDRPRSLTSICGKEGRISFGLREEKINGMRFQVVLRTMFLWYDAGTLPGQIHLALPVPVTSKAFPAPLYTQYGL